MVNKIEEAQGDEDIRPFVVLHEIKHNGRRYKHGDTIDLNYDEWVEMHDAGRVSGEESNARVAYQHADVTSP